MAKSSTKRRLAVLTEGGLDAFRNKTAMGLLRFCPQDVVCVIDSTLAGTDLEQLIGVGGGIPVVATVGEAVRRGVDYLVIGVATPGGYLPAELRPQVYEAIRNRVGVISGLHESVGGDPNLTSLAARHAVDIVNLRKVPDDYSQVVATGMARKTKAYRVLTVGTDCNIGKTTTTFQLERWMRQQRFRVRVVPTGQDGILIEGRGVCVDRVIADFAAGAAEQLVMREAKGVDLVLIEGQDSILSPPYSGVAVSLLHGSCPDAMILCHTPARVDHRHTDVPIPSLTCYRGLYESMLAPLHPGRVVAVALNTQGMDAAAASRAISQAHEETGLPTADVVRDGAQGCQLVADAVLAAARDAGHPLTPGVARSSRPVTDRKRSRRAQA